MKKILIVGAGGFGREVYWLISEINQHKPEWNVLGFLDDNRGALDGFKNYPPIVGKISDYWEIKNKHTDTVFLVNAIAAPRVRKDIVISNIGAEWATIIHPTVSIGINSVIGVGCVLARNSVVSCDAELGCHVHVNMYSSCDHDTIIGDFCTISLKADIQGGVVLGEGVFLGGSSVILLGKVVGEWAKVGASALVLVDILPKRTVAGVPAKTIGGVT